MFFDTEATLGFSYTVLEWSSGISQNKSTSLWNFVPNSELSQFSALFSHGTLIVAGVVNFV